MGSPVYANVNPQASLGADMFSQSEIDHVGGILSSLRAGKPVSSSDLQTSTMTLSSQRAHPLYGSACDEIVSAMFDSCPSSEAQADILGSLLVPENADLVNELLNMPDTSLAADLSSGGIRSVVEAAQAPTEPARTGKLILAAQEHLGRLPTREDEELFDQPGAQPAINANQSVASSMPPDLAEAVVQGNASLLETTIRGTPNADLPALSNQIAQMGDPARSVLQGLADSSNARTRDFVFSTLLQIGSAELPSVASGTASDYRDQMRGAGALDMASLEQMLMAPQNTFANLSRQLAGVPGVKANLIKLMLR
jgi:hypothetical protein